MINLPLNAAEKAQLQLNITTRMDADATVIKKKVLRETLVAKYGITALTPYSASESELLLSAILEDMVKDNQL